MALVLSLLSKSPHIREKATNKLATGVTLHGLCLTVASVVIWATTFVTGCWPWTTNKTSAEAGPIGSSRCHHPSANAKRQIGLKSGIRTRTLPIISVGFSERIHHTIVLQQDAQADHMNSSVLQALPHLCEGSGNLPGHDQGPDSGNTAWLEAPCQFCLPHIFCTSSRELTVGCARLWAPTRFMSYHAIRTMLGTPWWNTKSGICSPGCLPFPIISEVLAIDEDIRCLTIIT